MVAALDPIARLDHLLAGNDAEATYADELLCRIGMARGLHDTLSVHRALVAHKRGDATRALAEAWRAVWLFPDRAEPRVLLAHLLQGSGAVQESMLQLSKAAELAPDDQTIQRYYLKRLIAVAPAAARHHLSTMLPHVPLADAPALVSMAGDMLTGVPLGSAWRDEGRIVGWVASTSPVELAWWCGSAWSTKPVALAWSSDDIGTFNVDWPEEADGLVVRWAEDRTPLPGTPFVATPALPTTGEAAPSTPGTNERAETPIIDVIMPVHGGPEETRACLAAVLGAGVEATFELIVIDDAVPDADLRAHLHQLAAEKRITLISNTINLGFTASVNRALVIHPDRDVVLLNADTVVCDGWLDRMRRAALSDHRIGTVTPLSNNGQLVSHPAPTKAHPLPTTQEIRRLDRLAQEVNAGVTVDLPTGIGFCLYIRRPCLASAGYLDAERFGRGYGEETDFCLRAASTGWRNVCAADVYVGHHGSVSFGQEKATLVGHNMPKVAARHPLYHPLCRSFLRDDPLAPYRRHLERAALRPPPERAVLAIGPHHWRNDDVLRRHRFDALARGDWLYWLSFDTRESIPTACLEGEAPWGPGALRYRLPDEAAMLAADIERLGISEFHLHTPPAAPLREILDSHPARRILFVGNAETLETLTGVTSNSDMPATERVVVASRFAHEGITARHPDSGVTLDIPPPPSVQPDTGGVPGEIAVVTGGGHGDVFPRLLELARLAALSDLPLRFHVFDATQDDLALTRTQRAIILGSVPPEDRAAIARSLGCRVALCLGHEADPVGTAVDVAAQTCPRLLVVSGGAREERAALHPRAVVVAADTPAHLLLNELWTLSQ